MHASIHAICIELLLCAGTVLGTGTTAANKMARHLDGVSGQPILDPGTHLLCSPALLGSWCWYSRLASGVRPGGWCGRRAVSALGRGMGTLRHHDMPGRVMGLHPVPSAPWLWGPNLGSILSVVELSHEPCTCWPLKLQWDSGPVLPSPTPCSALPWFVPSPSLLFPWPWPQCRPRVYTWCSQRLDTQILTFISLAVLGRTCYPRSVSEDPCSWWLVVTQNSQCHVRFVCVCVWGGGAEWLPQDVVEAAPRLTRLVWSQAVPDLWDSAQGWAGSWREVLAGFTQLLGLGQLQPPSLGRSHVGTRERAGCQGWEQVTREKWQWGIVSNVLFFQQHLFLWRRCWRESGWCQLQRVT